MSIRTSLQRRPGSALLLTLLIVTAVSTIVLATTRLNLETQRSSGSLDNLRAATLQARSGLDEGLNKIAQKAVDSYGEDGTVKGTGLLAPKYHGYASGCTQLTLETRVEGSGYDPACPYYSLSIQTLIRAGDGGIALADGDLPLNALVRLLPVGSAQGSAGISLQLPRTSAVVECVEGCGSVGLHTNGDIIYLTSSDPDTTEPIVLRRTAGSLAPSGITVNSSTSAPFIFSRTNADRTSVYRCITSTGYAGGVQKTLRLSIAPSGTKTLLENGTCADRLAASSLTQEVPPLYCDGCKAYWKFDEGTGTVASDSSGNGYNGTLTGFSFGSNDVWVPGIFGGALKLNGSSSVVEAPTIDTGNHFTLSAWVDPTSAPSGSGVISQEYINGLLEYEIGFGIDEPPGGSSTLKVGFFDGARWRDIADPAGNTPINQWMNIVGTWDGNTMSLYRDGVQVATGTPGGSTATSNFKTFIGRRHDLAGSVNYFPGPIDDARIYPRALSATEVSDLYKASKR